MRLIVCLLVFVLLAAESPRDYMARFSTPMAYALPFVDRIRSLPFSAWDLVMGLVGLVALVNPKTWRGRARTLDATLAVSFGALLLAVVWGAARGGDVRQAFYQIAAMLQMFLTAHVVTAVFRSGKDYMWLGLTVLAAAVYRAAATMTFFVLFLRHTELEYYPESIAGHDVSALWVTAALGLAAWVLTSPRTKVVLTAAPLSLLLVLAMHYNNRRLAFVALAGGLVMVYLGMPIRRLSTRAKIRAAIVAPLVIAYVAAGWNFPQLKVFAPVAKLQSAVVGEDDSSLSRDIENTGLVVTLRMNPLGTGLGHEYVEVSPAFSQGMMSFFEQYRYIPHNALLGLVAFTGLLLFPLIWIFVPVGAFLAARASLFARHARDRLLATTAFATPFVYSVQAFGDMGLQSPVCNVLLAAALGAASRLVVASGAWGAKSRRARPARLAEPAARQPALAPAPR